MEIGSGPSSRRHPQPSSHIHKVERPPQQNLLTEFQTVIKETFFHDEPLKAFRGHKCHTRFFLVLQAIFPILEWARSYNLEKFTGDLIAGLTIASLCVPQDIAYAKLANLDPQYGLYSSFVPPLIYAFMGSSRDIAIGPVAVVSLLIGTMAQKEIDPQKNALAYRRLVFTATFFAGVTQFALGFFRLGFLIDFLSHAAIVGFMAGAAITIGLQQLKGLLGITNFTKKTDIISVMHSVFGSVHHGWNWQTIVIGMSFLAFLLLTKYIAKKYPKLFWVSAIAPLTSVIVATFCVYITRADKEGVAILARKRIWQAHIAVSFTVSDYNEKIESKKILRWLSNEEEDLKINSGPRIKYLVVEMSPVTDIDTSGIHSFEELHRTLQNRDVKLVLANPGAIVTEKLHASEFTKKIGEDMIFLTVADAIETLSPRIKELP
ncbi:hypothetical protein SO802_029383 [Lithocarpus litseifolius]|uniref:STAS domain-containing protein n=1 Tax=Lithocarpus litseifolius TaxID=425828 RepID=A0AAW2BWB6_9ROSI